MDVKVSPLMTLVSEFPPCPQAPSTPLSPHLTWVMNSGPNTLISSSSVCNAFQMFLTKDPQNCSKAVRPQMSPPFKGSHQLPRPQVPGVASASLHPSTSHRDPTTAGLPTVLSNLRVHTDLHLCTKPLLSSGGQSHTEHPCGHCQ